MEPVSGLGPWLRWAGGKRALAPRLVAEIMATKPKVYIEPFLGAGAVALALPADLPKVLSDVNPHLIDCWLCMQKLPGTLHTELKAVAHDYGNGPADYIKARSEFNQMVRNPRKMWARRSALFMFLNARCFNGLWRTNASGFFNVPFAKLDKPRVITDEELEAYRLALRGAHISDENFVRSLGMQLTHLSRATRGTLKELTNMCIGMAIYADPPYDGTFDGYAKDGFSEHNQRVLAQMLGSAAAAGAAVWASNNDTPLIREIYDWADIEVTNEQHSVGPTGAQRGKRGCVLIRGGAARGS